MASPFPVPLNAIRAIEIVARRGALAPAAEELGVTPGAVSQHLRRAEERLGIELFERTPQGLRPTDALRAVLPQLTAGFNTLAEAVANLRGADEHVLTVTVGQVFASRMIWARTGRRNDSVLPDPVPDVTTPGWPGRVPRSSIEAWCRYRRM